MQIIFILSVLSLFGASVYFASWASSVVFSFLILLMIWTRLFSDRIIKKSFKGLTPLHKTEFHHRTSFIQNAFCVDKDVQKPNIYLDPKSKNLQIYCFGSRKKPNVIASEQALKQMSPRDIQLLFQAAGNAHMKNSFFHKQWLVSMFLYVSSVFRYLDTGLSFVLGIKTKAGEPKALTRKPIYFFLNLLNFKYKRNQSEKLALKNYSYLSTKHTNPVMSPLSISDRSL